MLGDNGYEEKGDKQIKRGMGDIQAVCKASGGLTFKQRPEKS